MRGEQEESIDSSIAGDRDVAGPLIIYMNDQSGNRNAKEMRGIIQAELELARRPFRYLGRQSTQTLEQALTFALDEAKACSGTLVVSGGDGTINAAIALAVDRQQALAILPAGTFNFVARSHGIPEDTADAIKLILHARPQATRVGMINDRQFMVNASIGSYARLQREREGFKKTLGRTRGVASLAAIVSALHQSSRMRLHITSQSKRFSVDCSTLIMCNNRLQLELVGVDSLPGFGKDEMVCAVLAPVGVVTQLATIWRGFLGRVSETAELNTFIFNEIEIDLRRRRSRDVEASVDGEACRLRLPLVVKVSEKPLWLYRPLQNEEAKPG